MLGSPEPLPLALTPSTHFTVPSSGGDAEQVGALQDADAALTKPPTYVHDLRSAEW